MASIIHDFLNDRKEEWLKKKLKPGMNDEEKSEMMQQAQAKYTLAAWLPDAAKRASQLSMATHPSKFSHPSAKTSSIIARANQENDGYLRTGNVIIDHLDVFGNAAAMDVYKFLCLKLEDGRTILEHLEIESDQIKLILEEQPVEFQIIKQDFLMIKEKGASQATDSLVKQIYFPVGQDYHLLSVLTSSALLNRFKKQIDEVRFGHAAKEARESRKKEMHHPEGYDDLYGLTVTAYGGTKPQNISVLNSQNGGRFYLLQSLPPKLARRDIRLPTYDFFVNTLRMNKFKSSFQFLHDLMKADLNNRGMRKKIKSTIQDIIDRVVECAFQVRASGGVGWSQKEYYKGLPQVQRIWLDDAYSEERENGDEWIKSVSELFARWIARAYEKTLKEARIMLGPEELSQIRVFVNEAISEDQEFIK